MAGVGTGEYTEQNREHMRQLRDYLHNEWLKRKAAGTLSKKKIILPGAEPINKTKKPINKTKKPKTKTAKRKRKRRVRLFKIIEMTKNGDHIVLKEVGRVKRKNKKYKK